jgi:predicted ABC-type ATPase
VNNPLDQRPIIVAIAGPNGAGKTTFFQVYIAGTGLHFINADHLSRSMNLESYAAAKMAGEIRLHLVNIGESFVFETVFSDPVGDKISFLLDSVSKGYTVVLCFIGISSPDVSDERVSMRVSRGGHDVPSEKLKSRYPRTMKNLESAIDTLPHIWVFDNDDLSQPYRKVAVFENGVRTFLSENVPDWLGKIIIAREEP